MNPIGLQFMISCRDEHKSTPQNLHQSPPYPSDEREREILEIIKK
jgi:hypothetical protein